MTDGALATAPSDTSRGFSSVMFRVPSFGGGWAAVAPPEGWTEADARRLDDHVRADIEPGSSS